MRIAEDVIDHGTSARPLNGDGDLEADQLQRVAIADVDPSKGGTLAILMPGLGREVGLLLAHVAPAFTFPLFWTPATAELVGLIDSLRVLGAAAKTKCGVTTPLVGLLVLEDWQVVDSRRHAGLFFTGSLLTFFSVSFAPVRSPKLEGWKFRCQGRFIGWHRP